MFTTGNKFLIGATVIATVGALLYGITQGGTLGSIGLTSAAIALATLTGANLYFRDANVSAMDDSANLASVPAAQGPPGRSVWPLLFAFGAVTIVVGLVTQQSFFIVGIVAMAAGGAEWMVQAWAERSSSDSQHASEVRNRMANTLEYPLAGAIGVGALVFAFSRMMLWISKVGAVVIFALTGVVIIGVAVLLTAGGRRVPKAAVGGLLGIGAIAVITGGAAAGIDGERDIHVHETIEGLTAEGESPCDSPEEFEVDEKNSQSVALRSNQAATVTLTSDEQLVYSVPGPEEEGGEGLTVWRSNATNIVFENESGEARRLTLDLGTTTIVEAEDGVEVEREVANLTCTALVEEGGAQLLTFTVGVPSAAVEGGYRLFVPGVDGQEIEVIVP